MMTMLKHMPRDNSAEFVGLVAQMNHANDDMVNVSAYIRYALQNPMPNPDKYTRGEQA